MVQALRYSPCRDRGRDRPPPGVRFVRLHSTRARQLEDLVSRYNDLTFVLESGLRLRGMMRDPGADVTVIRALWSAMLSAYGRAFTTGKLRVLPVKMATRLTARWPQDHRALLELRNQHIAHAGDRQVDEVSIAVGYAEGPDGARIAQTIAMLQKRNLAWPSAQVMFFMRQAFRVRRELASVVNELQRELETEIAATPEMLLQGEDLTDQFVNDADDLGRPVEGPLGGWVVERRPTGERGEPL